MKRVHLIISGNVQGVGFRSWTKREALRRNLTGWVKNREDKTVEAVVEGRNEVVDEIVGLCRHGPEIAWVEHIQIKEELYKGDFPTFEIFR